MLIVVITGRLTILDGMSCKQNNISSGCVSCYSMDEEQTLSTGSTTDGTLIGTKNWTRHIAQRIFQRMTGIDQFIFAVVSTEDAHLNERSTSFDQHEKE